MKCKIIFNSIRPIEQHYISFVFLSFLFVLNVFWFGVMLKGFISKLKKVEVFKVHKIG